jgi:hypothetical protein
LKICKFEKEKVMAKAEYKSVPGFEGKYEVNRAGDVRRVGSDKHLATGGKPGNEFIICSGGDGTRKSFSIKGLRRDVWGIAPPAKVAKAAAKPAKKAAKKTSAKKKATKKATAEVPAEVPAEG